MFRAMHEAETPHQLLSHLINRSLIINHCLRSERILCVFVPISKLMVLDAVVSET